MQEADIICFLKGIRPALLIGSMKIKVGTIHELTGEGYEVLVDVPTRSTVLAKFFDGRFIREVEIPEGLGTEATIVTG